MKCKTSRKQILQGDEGETAPDLEAHLSTCPDCQALYQQTRDICSLVALKNFERRDPVRETRCGRSIRRRLEEEATERESFGAFLWDLLTGASLPTVRYAAVAVLLALVAIQFLVIPPGPDGDPVATQPTAEQPERTVKPVPVEKNSETYREAVAVPMQIVSNSGPGKIQYGPLPSRNVNYEY